MAPEIGGGEGICLLKIIKIVQNILPSLACNDKRDYTFKNT